MNKPHGAEILDAFDKALEDTGADPRDPAVISAVIRKLEDRKKHLARERFEPGDTVMWRKNGGSRVVGVLAEFRQKNAAVHSCRNLDTGNRYKRGRIVPINMLEPAPEGVEAEGDFLTGL